MNTDLKTPASPSIRITRQMAEATLAGLRMPEALRESQIDLALAPLEVDPVTMYRQLATSALQRGWADGLDSVRASFTEAIEDDDLGSANFDVWEIGEVCDRALYWGSEEQGDWERLDELYYQDLAPTNLSDEDATQFLYQVLFLAGRNLAIKLSAPASLAGLFPKVEKLQKIAAALAKQVILAREAPLDLTPENLLVDVGGQPDIWQVCAPDLSWHALLDLPQQTYQAFGDMYEPPFVSEGTFSFLPGDAIDFCQRE